MRNVLVMGGGNALGAFHAGAVERLIAAGWEPDVLAGSSIGAVTAALLAGARRGRRMEVLREFWARATVPTGQGPANRVSSLAALTATRTMGRPGMFSPALPSPLAPPPAGSGLYTLSPLRTTLADLIDVERLNRLPPRIVVHATDICSGAPRDFDSSRERLAIDHLLASSAFPLDFEPVTVDGEILCDGGMSANLPLSSVLTPPPSEDTLCIALDLFPANGAVPASLDDAMARRLDLIFADQARREVERVAAAHHQAENPGALIIAHVIHGAAGERVGQKMFDYSQEAIATRWEAGRRSMADMLARLPAKPSKGFAYLARQGQNRGGDRLAGLSRDHGR